MLDEVYDYLHDYGFTAIDLDEIENKNDEIFDASRKDVKKITTFLEEKDLRPDDVIEVINSNPFMLTERNNRLEELDYIYCGELAIDTTALANLIKTNPRTYTASPIELQKNIDYLIEKGYNISTIRKFILDNSQVINMKSDDFVKVLKIN